MMESKKRLPDGARVVVICGHDLDWIAREDLSDRVVVVCDPDGARAAEVSSSISLVAAATRTHVFVGDLAHESDRAAVRALCVEMFGSDPSADLFFEGDRE